MSKKTLLLFLAITAAPNINAETYKCKHTDGKITFQDQPCQVGAVESQIEIHLPPQPVGISQQPIKAASRKQIITAANQLVSKQSEELEKQRNLAEQARAQYEAQYRANQCNRARHNLGVLKEPRRVFLYTDTGDKKYIDNSDRASAVAEAQQRVSENCQ